MHPKIQVACVNENVTMQLNSSTRSSEKQASNTLEKKSIHVLHASKLFRIVWDSALQIDTTLITDLNNGVHAVGTKILSGAIVPGPFGAYTKVCNP